jgi:hypothetical protein
VNPNHLGAAGCEHLCRRPVCRQTHGQSRRTSTGSPSGSLLGTTLVIALGMLSYRRYRDQRWKMTELIFATAVIVDAAVSAAPQKAESAE